jgi:short-subunit dehydrogenase
MTAELEGQVALVTGAGRGIGRAIANELAMSGAAVMATSRTAEQLDETVALIQSAGGVAASCPADVQSQPDMEKVIVETERAFGPITLLVNNAGSGNAGRYETLDFASIRYTIENNLISAMLCSWLVLPGMLERGSGRIINVASGGGIIGMAFMSAYSTAKAGLIRFSESLALQVQGCGVSVFSITPGLVRTQPTEGLWAIRKSNPLPGWLGESTFPPNENIAADSSWLPAERAGSLCRFLASGKADRLSGRYFPSYDDEETMVRHADKIEDEMLYTLRLTTLDGVQRPITQEEVRAIHG